LNKEELPFKKIFDIVICVEIIEHLGNPHKLIRQINKALKKGGLCFLSTPNLQNLFERSFFLLKQKFRRFPVNSDYAGHINPVTLTEIKQLASFHGFKIKTITTEGLWIPIVRKYISESFRNLLNISFGESLIVILEKDSE